MSRAEAGRVCWVDEQWDRTSASDGVSRYGAYLRSHSERFEPFYGQGAGGVTLDPVEFTAGAFAVATGPIMSPGYVAWHPRVQGYQLGFGEDPEPGRLVCSVTLAAPAPIRLTGPWWGWTQEFSRWVDPPDSRPAALARLELRWPIGTDQLPRPTPPAAHRVPNLADAKAAVRAVVEQINQTGGPVLAELEAHTGGGRRAGW